MGHPPAPPSNLGTTRLCAEYAIFCAQMMRFSPSSPTPTIEDFVAAHLTDVDGNAVSGGLSRLNPSLEGSLAELVLYMVRNCRQAGFGLARSRTITYEEMKKGIARLLDGMEGASGVMVSDADRLLLIEQIPLYVYHIDVAYPNESISGVFWGATRQLQASLITFNEEQNVNALEKGEAILNFLSGLDLEMHLASELSSFRYQFAQAREHYREIQRSQTTWLDHLLNKALSWRQSRRAAKTNRTKENHELHAAPQKDRRFTSCRRIATRRRGERGEGTPAFERV